MPPAPTKPSTVAPRTLISKRSSVKLVKLASTCGNAAKRMVSTQEAPAARKPSTGFMSMFSVVSKNCLPSAPTLWIAIARTPANGPRPKATTKINANTTSGTVRQNSRKRRVRNTVVAPPVRFGEARKLRQKATIAPLSVPT